MCCYLSQLRNMEVQPCPPALTVTRGSEVPLPWSADHGSGGGRGTAVLVFSAGLFLCHTVISELLCLSYKIFREIRINAACRRRGKRLNSSCRPFWIYQLWHLWPQGTGSEGHRRTLLTAGKMHKAFQLSGLPSWQEQSLQMRNHGLPQNREGERPSGWQQQLCLLLPPGSWPARRPLPQAALIQAPSQLWSLLLHTQSIMCSFPPSTVPRQGNVMCSHGARSSILGRQKPQGPAEHPEQCREGWSWESCHECKFPDSA